MVAWFLLLFFLLLTLSILLLLFYSKTSDIVVVCIGEIERSPRTIYHVDCFLSSGRSVSLICINKNQIFIDERWGNINVYHIWDVDYFLRDLPRIIALSLKLLLQSMLITKALYSCGYFNIMLVQNPPSVPVLGVCALFKFLTKSGKFIIDWHNFGYTILYSTTKNRRLSQIYQRFEFHFGKHADLNLTVTEGMKEFLNAKGIKNCLVLRDKPADIFKPLSNYEQKKFLQYLYSSIIDDANAIQEFKSDASILIVSSTSWTEDEDFEILLQALVDYDAYNERLECPNIHCIITGKGKLKSYYEEKIKSLEMKKVRIFMLWLSFSDYAKLLASATLGVCLHTSSSGYDFPMKVIDMLGCKLPVCAFEFNCLKEVIFDKVNGFYFRDKDDLFRIFYENFIGFDKYLSIRSVKKTLEEESISTFPEEWKRVISHCLIE